RGGALRSGLAARSGAGALLLDRTTDGRAVADADHVLTTVRTAGPVEAAFVHDLVVDEDGLGLRAGDGGDLRSGRCQQLQHLAAQPDIAVAPRRGVEALVRDLHPQASIRSIDEMCFHL